MMVRMANTHTPTTPEAPTVGSFVRELLVTDTRVYEVVAVTARTLTLRPTRDTDWSKSENRDGNPYPLVWTGQQPDPTAPTRLVRLRKDGTYRTHRSANPLRPATVVDGHVARFTDYRV